MLSGYKKLIDLTIPTAIAGLVYYQLGIKSKQDSRKAIISAVAVFVMAYIIVSQLTRAINNAPKTIPVPNDPGLPSGGDVDALAWATRIYDDIKGFNWLLLTPHDAKLYSDLVLLSDSNLAAIYNAWELNFKAAYGNKDLIDALKDESFGNMFSGIADNMKVIIQRLQKLKTF